MYPAIAGPTYGPSRKVVPLLYYVALEMFGIGEAYIYQMLIIRGHSKQSVWSCIVDIKRTYPVACTCHR